MKSPELIEAESKLKLAQSRAEMLAAENRRLKIDLAKKDRVIACRNDDNRDMANRMMKLEQELVMARPLVERVRKTVGEMRG